MTTILPSPPLNPPSIPMPPWTPPDFDDVEVVAKVLPVIEKEPAELIDPANPPVISGAFVATLSYAGIIGSFKKLQVLLKTIGDAEPDLHSYGSGAIFEQIVDVFHGKSENVFANTDLFGSTDPLLEDDTIGKTNLALQQISNAMELIRQALDLIDSMYNRVNNILRNMNAEYLSTIARTEYLLTWAYRRGAKLNPELVGIKNIGINTKTEINRTDLYGLLSLFDDLTLELQTMMNLPAYYRTGTAADSDQIGVPVKIVTVNKDESIHDIAARELGDADKAIMILDFNDIKYNDVLNDGWSGRELKIPYVSPQDSDRFENNFVLDAHSGVEALGKDLPAELILEEGDLKTLNYTNNFEQSLNNILQTALGAIAEQPDYGNRIMQIDSEMIPPLSGETAAIEAQRALMTNPRVSEILNIKASKDKNETAVRINYQVRSINHLTEATLTANLDES